MKHLFILGVVLMPTLIHAAAPSTSCPAGFVAVDEPYITLEKDSCPTGYTAVGTASSCLVSSPQEVCMMYAPADTSYSDSTGSYTYVSICPLTP